MSSIQKITNLKGVSYRVYIRRKGLKSITKTFPSKSLASQFVSKMEGDRQLQSIFRGNNSKITFSELLVDYLKHGFKGKSLADQKSKLNYWENLIGSKQLMDITKHDITNGLHNLPSKLANATINRYKAAISVVFSYACREYGLHINPVRRNHKLCGILSCKL